MEVRTCTHCNKSFEFAEGRVFSNHVRWCDQNPNRTSGRTTERFAEAREATLARQLGKIKIYNVLCCKCGVTFEVREREFQHPKKDKYHCSIGCRNSHDHTEEFRKKVSETLKQKYASGAIPPPTGGRGFTRKKKGEAPRDPSQPRERIAYREPIQVECPNCNKTFITDKGKKFCNADCRRQYDRKNLSDIASYKAECRFRFHIKDFPEEFDFDLIREYGWYKAANHGDNLGGVSRDHMVSIRWGFDHGILPSLLRHPANCRLLRHSENSSKHKKCSLTVEELLDRIEAWNAKYGPRAY